MDFSDSNTFACLRVFLTTVLLLTKQSGMFSPDFYGQLIPMKRYLQMQRRVDAKSYNVSVAPLFSFANSDSWVLIAATRICNQHPLITNPRIAPTENETVEAVNVEVLLCHFNKKVTCSQQKNLSHTLSFKLSI